MKTINANEVNQDNKIEFLMQLNFETLRIQNKITYRLLLLDQLNKGNITLEQFTYLRECLNNNNI